MSKLARRSLFGLGLLILLLVVIIVGAFWYVDSLARQGIQRGASYALGVPTTVRSVDVGVLRGTLELDGLRIANPPGFEAPTFLAMEDGRTAVALGTLRRDTIVIPELRLADIDVTLQRRPGQAANYKVILENLEKLGKTKPGERPPDQPGAEKRIIVNELVISNITIHADLLGGPGALGEAAGQLGRVTIPIDEVRLKDVGKTGEGVAGTGVTIGQLAGLVVEAVLAAAAEKGGDLLPAEILGDLRTQLAELGNLQELGITFTATAEELGRRLQEARTPEEIGEVIREGTREVERITEGLKGVIPPREKKK